MFTDENDAIRPLLRHLIENHRLKRIAFLAVLPGADAAAAESFMRDFDRELEALNRYAANNEKPAAENAPVAG